MLLYMFARSNPMSLQLTFILLQLADVGTTMTVLAMGGVEQNAFVSRLMLIGSLQGLILSKVVVLAAGAVAIRFHKSRAIRWANIIFGAIVLWNVSVIVRLALRSHQS